MNCAQINGDSESGSPLPGHGDITLNTLPLGFEVCKHANSVPVAPGGDLSRTQTRSVLAVLLVAGRLNTQHFTERRLPAMPPEMWWMILQQCRPYQLQPYPGWFSGDVHGKCQPSAEAVRRNYPVERRYQKTLLDPDWLSGWMAVIDPDADDGTPSKPLWVWSEELRNMIIERYHHGAPGEVDALNYAAVLDRCGLMDDLEVPREWALDAIERMIASEDVRRGTAPSVSYLTVDAVDCYKIIVDPTPGWHPGTGAKLVRHVDAPGLKPNSTATALCKADDWKIAQRYSPRDWEGFWEDAARHLQPFVGRAVLIVSPCFE